VSFESARRAATAVLSRPGYPDVVLRDQTPMSCLLDGMTPAEWYRTLNSMVFFFASRRKLEKLRNARAGRHVAQLVLSVDTRSLVSAYRDRVLLSGMNTGATVRRALPRGSHTFLPIADFPYQERRKTRAPMDALVEVTIVGGVPDIVDHLIAVEEVASGTRTQIWPLPSDGARETRA
jgi:hypothetical protein